MSFFADKRMYSITVAALFLTIAGKEPISTLRQGLYADNTLRECYDSMHA